MKSCRGSSPPKVIKLGLLAPLAGTLLLPSTRGPHPAAVFLHGSGAQDRNGYVSLIRLTADHFAPARNSITDL